MDNSTAPAFPVTCAENGVIANEGLTKREYFAAMVLPQLVGTMVTLSTWQKIKKFLGLKPTPHLSHFKESCAAKLAVRYADALLSELSKTKEG